MAKEFKLDDREWRRTMPLYIKSSKRDFATAMNTKGFFIARRSTVETPKASAAAIRAELRQTRRKTFTVRGKARVSKTTLGELIVHARRASAGEERLNRQEAKKIAAIMTAKRVRGSAFIKAGWLPSIKKLEPISDRRGIPRQDKSGKQFGKPKGFAVPAKNTGWRPSCLIQNDALAKGSERSGALAIAGPALQRAFDFETKSMKDYIARKLAQSAQKLGIKATT